MDEFPRSWMWSQARELIARAERLHQQFFEPRHGHLAPVWEPPVDILETPSAILIYLAVPGVKSDQIETTIQDGTLVISGRRELPSQLCDAVIHRLELPQGRFFRRIALPVGRYEKLYRSAIDGCILVTLEKLQVDRG